MDRKKKFLSIFLSTLFVIFFGITLGNTCKAITINDYELTDEIMQDIVNELGLGSYYSGDFIPNLTNNFNTIMRTVRARGDSHLVTLADVMILGNYTNLSNNGGKDLQVFFFDWREGYNNDDSTLETFTPYIPFNGSIDGQTISGTKQIFKWNGWTYDSANNINGVTTVSQFQFWRFSNTSISNPTTTLAVHQPTLHIRYNTVGMNKAIIFDNYRSDGEGYVQIASRTTENGYGFYLWADNIFYLEDYGTTPTPTPTPTLTPTGEGGSTDLTNTNNLIGQVNNSLNSVPSGDDFSFPSSGELTSSLGITDFSDFPEVSATDNFWLAITNGLYNAFTSDVRYYDIDFLGINFTLDNQAFIINNQYVNSFLNIIEVVTFVFVEYKIIRKLVNMFSSGVFSQIMRAYGKIDISDLF